MPQAKGREASKRDSPAQATNCGQYERTVVVSVVFETGAWDRGILLVVVSSVVVVVVVGGRRLSSIESQLVRDMKPAAARQK